MDSGPVSDPPSQAEVRWFSVLAGIFLGSLGFSVIYGFMTGDFNTALVIMLLGVLPGLAASGILLRRLVTRWRDNRPAS
jgi:uncharacterized membrane protein YqaE (UPF0057 family)